MRRDIIELYDAYTHEHLDRRVFMDRLARKAGGTAAAAALVPVLEANYASAAIVPESDARLTIEEVTFPGAGGDVQGYLARPADATGPLPGVVVIHENRGLNPISRTLRGGPPSRVSWPWHRISCRPRAARPTIPTRPAT